MPLFAVFLLPAPGAGQAGAVQGRVWSDDGSAVVSAVVQLGAAGSERWARAVETDDLGFFRVEGLAAGRYRLRVSRIGFAEVVRSMELSGGGEVDVEIILERSAVVVEGISVEAERSRARVRFEADVGRTIRELAGDQIQLIPGVAEADPIRAVEVLPGVTTVSDFSAAFNVRGGSADQNLVLLDGVPIFNPFHLGGLFSVFNADMVRRAELETGGFPARYGGRVSSVLRVETDAGDGELSADAGVSLLASRLAVDGAFPQPWVDGLGLRNLRWRASARRSYFDFLLRPFFEFPYHLTDLQGVLEGWTRGGNRFTVTGYRGRDVLDLSEVGDGEDDFPLKIRWNWGNDVAGVRWTHPRAGGGSLEFGTSYSGFSSDLTFPDFGDTRFSTEIDQLTLTGDLQMHPSPDWTLTTGLVAARLDYANRALSGGTVFEDTGGRGTQLGGYVQSEWSPAARWRLEAGVRVDGWFADPGATEWVPSPRLALKRFVGEDFAVKAAAGRYSQFLHSVRDEELPLGIDVWVLAGQRAPPVVSDQVQLGVETFLGEDWFVSAETYVRTFDGVITNNLADDPNDALDNLLPGDGEAYGADFFIEKSGGETTGWLSLSLLRTERTFPDFRKGIDPAPPVTYPPVFDRRVEADLVLRRPVGWGVEAGLRWNVGSGAPFTRPVSSFRYFDSRIIRGTRIVTDDDFGGSVVVLGARNGARYPVRHRLDLSFRKTVQRDWGELRPYLDILNVYNQRNVLFYFFEYDETPPVRTGVSMIPLLPTLGIEVSF